MGFLTGGQKKTGMGFLTGEQKKAFKHANRKKLFNITFVYTFAIVIKK